MNQRKINSVNIFEQISQICREFRKRISQGKTPEIEKCLLSVAEDGRENLFSNLLEIEINFLRTKGQTPTSEEYLKRYPQFAKQVRLAFFEPTMGSIASVGSIDGETRSLYDAAASPADTQTFEIPAAKRLGDYELVREVGRGGMGVVYEARHLERNNRVALKTLPTGVDGQEINADRLHRFRKEFRSLSEINYPNLVGMQSLEVDGSQWFFTMDLIEGEDFLSYVRPGDQLDEERLRSALKQLAGGIIALHEHKIVHRDLKPSNVLVDGSGRVVILDFGLVAQLQTNTDLSVSRSGMFAGTPRYAAPEQVFGERSEASDWYAFGTMLYEALTGKLPFTGKPMELLLQKQNEDPPGLAEQSVSPRDLATLTDRLVRRDPGARPTTSEIVEQLQLDLGTRTYGSTAGSHGSAGSVDEEQLDPLSIMDEELVLIGRDQQLAQLEAAKQELLDKRNPVVVWIEGKSGEGKSSLAEKFLRPIRLGTEMLVLSGRCYDRESVPFKVIDSQIDALVRFLRLRGDNEVDALLPRNIEMLAHLFPALSRVQRINDQCKQPIAGVEDRQIRNLAIEALKELLSSIGRSTPVILFVDDLQWGDADSAEILANMVTSTDPPAMLFVGSCRSDEMSNSPFLNEWNEQLAESAVDLEAQQVVVEPLTESQCLEFLSTLWGDSRAVSQSSVSKLFASCKGNPYFLEQMIEGFDSTTGSFDPIPLAQVINKRNRRCPAGADALLKSIAVAGKAVPIDEVIQFADQSTSAYSTITHMRSEKLVRLIGDGSDGQIDTYHDKIRETVLDQLTKDERRDLHLKYADLIAKWSGILESSPEQANITIANDRLFDLAHHYLLADDPKAFYYQLRAGQAALEAFAAENALEHLRTAERLKPGQLMIAHEFRLQFLLAEALSVTEQLAEAEPYYKRALELASDDNEAARCHFGLGVSYMRLGQPKLSKSSFDFALGLLGERQPDSPVKQLLAISINFTRILMWPFESRVKENAGDIDSKEFLISKIYSLYRNVAAIDLLAFAYSGIRVVVICRKWGNSEAKAMAYANLALQMGLSGAPILAKSYAKKAERILKQTKCSEYASAQSAVQLSAYYLLRGELDRGEQLATGALPILKRERDYAYFFSLHWLRHIYSVRGIATGIFKYASTELELGEATGDGTVTGYGLYGMADAYGRVGEFDKACAAAQQAVDTLESLDACVVVPIARQEQVRALVQSSAYDRAQKLAAKALRYIWKEWTFLEFSLDTYPLYVEALCANQWQRGPQAFSSQQRQLIARMARRSRIVGLAFPNLKVHALRVSGRACVASGNPRKGKKYFDKAIAAAQKIGAKYEQARATLDKSMLDYPEAKTDRQRGLELLESLGCVLPDAEVDYLGIDRAAHHARAAEARDRQMRELETTS